MFDVLFQNATIIDGTGVPRRTGSVGVTEGILHMATACSPAYRIVNASGLVLSPGFIDVHSHGDSVVGSDFARACKTTQGITTEIAGMCGSTLYPSPPTQRDDTTFDNNGDYQSEQDHLQSGKAYFNFVDAAEKSCNMALFTGHNALRVAVMGYSPEKPTPKQMEDMKDLLREAMEHGSQGLSTGLFYPPSGYADIEEIVELCKVVAEYDGIHTSHIRDESARVLESVQEIIEIARCSGVRSNISHHKICGKNEWGASKETLSLIDEANHNGLNITLDQYPYTASCTHLSACIPKYCFSDGVEALLQRLREPAYRKMIQDQIAGDDPAFDGRYRQCGGFENIMIGIAPRTPEAVGLAVAEYARRQGKPDFDTYFDLLLANQRECFGIFFSMSDEDLFRIIQHPNCMVGSDGIVTSSHGGTHPRGWGTFPRTIRLFVRENKLLTLEQMIHKMTQLPAKTYRLTGRGVIEEGAIADLVLFSENAIQDMANYASSTERCVGIHMVMVGGKVVYENGEMTECCPGHFLPAR